MFSIEIFYFLKFEDQIIFKKTCRKNNKQKIKDLLYINDNIKKRITQPIIDKYLYLEKLDISSNININKINHLVNLKILKANGTCGIDNDGINLKNLKKLSLKNNETISNIYHLKNLEILIASENSQVGDEHIKELNLKKLDCSMNNNITKISHMTKLEYLKIIKKSGITNEEIKKMDIKIIKMTFNNEIKDIKHMKKIKILILGKALIDYDKIEGYKMKRIIISNKKIPQETECYINHEEEPTYNILLNKNFNICYIDNSLKASLVNFKINLENLKIKKDLNKKNILDELLVSSYKRVINNKYWKKLKEKNIHSKSDTDGKKLLLIFFRSSFSNT